MVSCHDEAVALLRLQDFLLPEQLQQLSNHLVDHLQEAYLDTAERVKQRFWS